MSRSSARVEREDSRGVGSDPGSGRPSWVTIGWLTLLFAGESLASLAFQAPHQLFVRFVAMDSGGELAIQDLIRRGLRPGIDFAYPYGLLSLLAGRIWYGAAGLSPGSFNAYVTVGLLGSAWGLARFAVYRGLGLAGLALIALAIPDLISVGYITSTHVIEQALLIHALAEQARGRRGRALALLTACCFVKPSLAFLEGFAVLMMTLGATWRSGRRALVRSVVPPAVTGVVIGLILVAVFGPVPLLKTLSPATGAAIYRANKYGFFFGEGREFWALPNAGLRDYFRYELGFWVLGTLALIGGGGAGAWRLLRGRRASEGALDDEVVVTCASVHLLFIVLLFGHRWTWVYSLPMLILGLATLSRRGPRWRWGIWGLAVLLLVSDRSKAVAIVQRRAVESPSPITLGLWTGPGEREEWVKALELTRGQRPVLLATCEGAPLLFPGFAPPVAGYLVPGNMLPVEARRKADQLAQASMIIAYHPPDPVKLESWPMLKAAFADCELIFDGKSVRVYRRNRPIPERANPPPGPVK